MVDDLNAVISAAVGSATEEVTHDPTGGAPAPAAETPETPEPPKEEAAPAAPEPTPEPVAPSEPKDEEEEFFTPTAEELAAIEADPRLQKVYKSMQRGLTKKSQSIAEQRKAHEERLKIVDWIQSDPERAIRAMASVQGLSIAEAKATVSKTVEDKIVDSLQAKWHEKVGAEASDILLPLFKETAQQVVSEMMGPVKETTDQLARAATERGVAASVREFGASIVERGEEWTDEIQAEMAELSKVMEPAADDSGNQASISDYMAALYDAVQARHLRARTAKGNLDRLRRIKQEQEPIAGVRSIAKPAESITVDMNDRDAIAMAVRLAQRDAGQR